MSHSSSDDVVDSKNKPIALLIAVLALLLALSEMVGKNAETEALVQNVEASNLWAFFQAKTIRRAAAITASEEMAVTLVGVSDPALKAAMEKQIAAWKANAARLESEPDTKEGRKELIVRAKAAEASRDLNRAKDDMFEYASAALQLAIVLASAAIITGLGMLVWLSVGFGAIGVIFIGLGQFAPTLLGL